MRKSHKDVWPLLDNQKVKEESPVDKIKRQVSESESIRKSNLK